LRQRAVEAGVSAEVVVQHGDPVGVIALHANARAADLVIVGGSARSKLFRASSAKRLARRIHAPLLVVTAATQVSSGFPATAPAYPGDGYPVAFAELRKAA
jgi:hypothetical protein